MAYYVELKNRAKPEVMDFPIASLGLRPYTQYALKKLAINVSAVKDLLSIKKYDLRECLQLKIPNHSEVDEIIQDIEECLATIGVKMQDSNFSVYDVSSQRLGVSVYSAIIKLWPEATTIGDVSIIGNKKLKKLPLDIYRQLVDKLDRYGIKIEGDGHVILKSKIFKLPEIVQQPRVARSQPMIAENRTYRQEDPKEPQSSETIKLPKSPTAEQVAQYNQKVAALFSPDFYHKKLRDIKFKRGAMASILKYAADLEVCDLLGLTKTELRTLMHDNSPVINYLENYFESRGFSFKRFHKKLDNSEAQTVGTDGSNGGNGGGQSSESGATGQNRTKRATSEPKAEFIIKRQEDLARLPASLNEEIKRILAITINNCGVGSMNNLDPEWFRPGSETFEYVESLVSWYFKSKIENKLPATLVSQREVVKRQIAEEIRFYDRLVRIKQQKIKDHSPLITGEVTGSVKKTSLFEILNKFKRNPNTSGIVTPMRVKKYNPSLRSEKENLFVDEIDSGLYM